MRCTEDYYVNNQDKRIHGAASRAQADTLPAKGAIKQSAVEQVADDETAADESKRTRWWIGG